VNTRSTANRSASAVDDETIQVEIFGIAADKPAISHAVAVFTFAAGLANPHGPRDGFDLGEVFVVAARDSVLLEGERRAAAASFVAHRLHGAQDDVVGPELRDLFLRLGADALADRQQPDHARRADEDAEYREQRAQRVQQEAFDSELPRA